MSRLLYLALVACISFSIVAQQPGKPLTNDDVLAMTKAGLKDQTIMLAIGHGPSDFDTSPATLVKLKKSGVSDTVLDEMLRASKSIGTGTPSMRPIAASETTDPSALLDKALLAIAPRNVLTSISSTKVVLTSTQIKPGGTTTFRVERQIIFPDRIYEELHGANNSVWTLVIRPDGSYATNGSTRVAAPSAVVEDRLTWVKFDVAYIAQHLSEFTLTATGTEDIGTDSCERLQLISQFGEQTWSIDSTGRIRRRVLKSSFGGTTVIDYFDFKSFGGLQLAAHRHAVEPNGTTDTTIEDFQANPAAYAIKPEILDEHGPPPSDPQRNYVPTQAPGGLTIRVLEAQSVPYVQKLGGGPSTSCNITGSSNTTMSATTVGNYTDGNANTTTGLHLNCNSYDTTVNWPHVLNVMLVTASDGIAYMIACDRAWAWSKCVPLRAGDTFNARQTSKGLAVQAFNSKGKESEPTYAILQSKVLN